MHHRVFLSACQYLETSLMQYSLNEYFRYFLVPYMDNILGTLLGSLCE